MMACIFCRISRTVYHFSIGLYIIFLRYIYVYKQTISVTDQCEMSDDNFFRMESASQFTTVLL